MTGKRGGLLGGLDALRKGLATEEGSVEQPSGPAAGVEAAQQPSPARPKTTRKAPAKAAPAPAPAPTTGGLDLPAWDGGTASRSGGKNPNLGTRVQPKYKLALDQLVFGLKAQGWPIEHHHVVELLLEELLTPEGRERIIAELPTRLRRRD
ncbi:hypothetical protein [Deinococcus radiotolerans]|uniref:DUF5681 domain-containing protein n=1 Tax=Deinococcus radiotolerans TaxID=1309407 RepID=A0ABQ2FQK0_9DEIO|nr:hypothetical protein [Deinococcus radiotolerans]GGL16811.1 hypothetical protein GCM10010844_39680 [Deinococcus radiotolerans]